MNLAKDVEIASKSLVLGLSVLYVSGLAVTSVHLSRYGFYSLDLLRTHYLLAGAYFWLVPSIVVGLGLLVRPRAIVAGRGRLAVIGGLLVVYMVLFVRLVYPGIPATIGGGKPVFANFVFKDRKQQELENWFLEPYRLLLPSRDGFLVISIRDPTTLYEIQRSEVLAVQLSRHKPAPIPFLYPDR